MSFDFADKAVEDFHFLFPASVLTATALPAYQAGRLFSLRRGHAVKGTVRPAFQRRQVFIGVISHAFPPFCFPLPFSPKRFPAPFLRRVLYTFCSPVGTANLSAQLQDFPCQLLPNSRILLMLNPWLCVPFSPQNPPVLLPPKSVCLAWDSPFPASAVAKGITH